MVLLSSMESHTNFVLFWGVTKSARQCCVWEKTTPLSKEKTIIFRFATKHRCFEHWMESVPLISFFSTASFALYMWRQGRLTQLKCHIVRREKIFICHCYIYTPSAPDKIYAAHTVAIFSTFIFFRQMTRWSSTFESCNMMCGFLIHYTHATYVL